MIEENKAKTRLGSVVQIIQMGEGREGWVGAFVLVTQVHGWGIEGFVHVLASNTAFGQAYTRLNWDEIEYIGEATVMPGDSEG